MDRAFFIKVVGAIGASGIVLPSPFSFTSGAEASDDWKKIRQHFSFPDDYIYLNTAGVGAVPVFVRQAVMERWNETEIYPKPGHDHAEWMGIKKEIAHLTGVVDPEYIALTNSATEGINIVLNGISVKEGDEIITSTHEHPALHVPLINLAKRKRLKIRYFEPDLQRTEGNVDRIIQLMSHSTRLVFISMVTCTTGQLLPVRDIILAAHSRGIPVALDGAQTAGQIELNLEEVGVDFFTSGGQKWLLGPKRTGFLYVNPGSINLIQPTTVGAYSEASYSPTASELVWAQGATRFEYATQNESLFEGLRRSVSFLNQLSMSDVVTHNRSLSNALIAYLTQNDHYRLFSPLEVESQTSIISFGHREIPFQDLAAQLMKRKIRVRVVTEGGMQAVRVAFHLYNSMEDVQHLIGGLQEISQT